MKLSYFNKLMQKKKKLMQKNVTITPAKNRHAFEHWFACITCFSPAM